MFTKVLTEEQVKEFNKLLGLNATDVFISKNKKYYYATVVEHCIKMRISKTLAIKFI